MSDLGLFGSVYDQLRVFSDKFDRLLIDVRSPDQPVASNAQQGLAALLHNITNQDNLDPSVRMIRLILEQELPKILGMPITVCESLADGLLKHTPASLELIQLEKIASVIDRECTSTLARMKGRA